MLRQPLFLLALSLFSTCGANADIFTWKDTQGRTHFGDRPPAESNPAAVELQINSVDRPELKTPTEGGSQVVIYTAAWCGVCRQAKRYFQQQGVHYQEFDVEKSPKGRRDYARLKGTGVPIILVGQTRMNGFSPARFDSIYLTP